MKRDSRKNMKDKMIVRKKMIKKDRVGKKVIKRDRQKEYYKMR